MQPRQSTWRTTLRLSNPLPTPARPVAEAQKNVKEMARFSKPPEFQNASVSFRELPSRGGGRGFVAVNDIPPGEIILRECPSAEIPDEPRNRDPSVRCVLQLISGNLSLNEVTETIADLKILHPQTIEDISPDHLTKLRKMYQGLFREVCASQMGVAVGLNDPDVFIRLVCALHFNGFATGVYLHLAMINHSCVPNCVKWGARDGVPYSEVRATRHIKAGEEICVSYLVPPMRSKYARDQALHGQFQFTCSCALCVSPPPALEEGPEEAVETLERELEYVEQHELEREPHMALSRVIAAKDAAVKAGLGKRHITLARAEIIITEACLALLNEGSGVRKQPNSDGLVFTLLKSSLSIRQTQCLVLNVGVPEEFACTEWRDTRYEAEPTLQHIEGALGKLTSLGKKGVDRLLTLINDQGDFFFQDVKDIIECQRVCSRVAAGIADLYDD